MKKCIFFCSGWGDREDDAMPLSMWDANNDIHPIRGKQERSRCAAPVGGRGPSSEEDYLLRSPAGARG